MTSHDDQVNAAREHNSGFGRLPRCRELAANAALEVRRCSALPSVYAARRTVVLIALAEDRVTDAQSACVERVVATLRVHLNQFSLRFSLTG